MCLRDKLTGTVCIRKGCNRRLRLESFTREVVRCALSLAPFDTPWTEVTLCKVLQGYIRPGSRSGELVSEILSRRDGKGRNLLSQKAISSLKVFGEKSQMIF